MPLQIAMERESRRRVLRAAQRVRAASTPAAPTGRPRHTLADWLPIFTFLVLSALSLAALMGWAMNP